MRTPHSCATYTVMQMHRALARTQNNTRGPILLHFLAKQEGGLPVGIYAGCMDVDYMNSMDPSSNGARMVSVHSRWHLDPCLASCWHLDIQAPEDTGPLQLLVQTVPHSAETHTNLPAVWTPLTPRWPTPLWSHP